MLKVFSKDLSSTGDSVHSAPIVFIRGATGLYSLYINGLFDPTEEKSSDGRVVYKKRGDADTIIEHFSGDWQIKRAREKGLSVYCCTFVRGGCALEACADRVWRVVEANAVHDRENVKMSSGAEAEAQASSLDARAHASTTLPRPSLRALPPMVCPVTRFTPSSAIFFHPVHRAALTRFITGECLSNAAGECLSNAASSPWIFL